MANNKNMIYSMKLGQLIWNILKSVENNWNFQHMLYWQIVINYAEHSLIPVTCVYMALFVKKCLIQISIFKTTFLKIQNINGGIFVPFGKTCLLLLGWMHLFCHTNEYIISDLLRYMHLWHYK